jgi:hypothetical protein
MSDFNALLGKTLQSVTGLEKGSEHVDFVCDDGARFSMYHCQDCCESVQVEDITGDVTDLIGSPIVRAEENSSQENPEGVTPEYQDSFTWTFYRIGTAKGTVVIRWYGESNGYYGEMPCFGTAPPAAQEE